MSAAAHAVAPSSGPSARATTAEQAGRRVEEVLDRLAATGDPKARAAAEELVGVLMDFYGAGLARIVRLLDAPAAGRTAAAPITGLLTDELVSSLLVLHDLHPEDAATRIGRALESVGDDAWETAGFDEGTGILRLRYTAGTGCGCASTGTAAQQAVEDALACFAPEVTAVETEQVTVPKEPALLQIGTPHGLRTSSGPAPAKAP